MIVGCKPSKILNMIRLPTFSKLFQSIWEINTLCCRRGFRRVFLVTKLQITVLLNERQINLNTSKLIALSLLITSVIVNFLSKIFNSKAETKPLSSICVTMMTMVHLKDIIIIKFIQEPINAFNAFLNSNT